MILQYHCFGHKRKLRYENHCFLTWSVACVHLRCACGLCFSEMPSTPLLQWMNGTGAAEKTFRLKETLVRLHAHLARLLPDGFRGTFKLDDFLHRYVLHLLSIY